MTHNRLLIHSGTSLTRSEGTQSAALIDFWLPGLIIALAAPNINYEILKNVTIIYRISSHFISIILNFRGQNLYDFI